VEGGVPGGVEGGIEGGVVGGVVGGLTGLPTPPPRVVRIGGRIKEPRLVRRVQPEYPTLARQARIVGAVALDALVDVRGHVQEVRVLSGPPFLREAAAEAVKQWRYQPCLLNGEPVAFELTITVNFVLN
jgi:protein TonB